ncbi:MAG: succinate dehydrogenase iron-sulfur subunit [Chlamydiales bacterium]|nr:succinate dehydrogenase iron-sulfur subunit [Chlamydiales bacterium]
MNQFILKVYRGSPGYQYWEEFLVPYDSSSNIISILMEIQKNPLNKQGKKVDPVVWEMGCLEEVCGSCSMLINGRPRQACSAIIENIIKETNHTTITLAPFSKYPLVRDLIVDRSALFESLKKAHAWIEVDSANRDHFVIEPEKQEVMYALSTCMSCGCCTESCPQVNEHSKFMGPAVISQVRLFNMHPMGKPQRSLRLQPMMEEGGVIGCGNAQNCVKVCPKNIPLTESIATLFRDTEVEAFKRLFSLSDDD